MASRNNLQTRMTSGAVPTFASAWKYMRNQQSKESNKALASWLIALIECKAEGREVCLL